MYTIYLLKSIDGIKLRLKRSVRTAGSVKLEELRREVAESFASRRWGGSRRKKRGLARLVNLEKLLEHKGSRRKRRLGKFSVSKADA